MCGDTSLPVKSLSQRVLELSQVDPVTGKSGFLTQLQVSYMLLFFMRVIVVLSLYRLWSPLHLVMKNLIVRLLRFLTIYPRQEPINTCHVTNNNATLKYFMIDLILYSKRQSSCFVN